MPRGGSREGAGAKEKAEDKKVDRRNVSLYPWEWDVLLRAGEGPTDAVRRLIYGSIVFIITGRQSEIGEAAGCWLFGRLVPNAFTRARAGDDTINMRFKVPHRLEGWEHFAIEGPSLIRRYDLRDGEFFPGDETVSYKGADLWDMLAKIFAPAD